MRDFTVGQYKSLLNALKESGIPFRLRHDVDRLPEHSLRIANVEAAMGVHSVYYFRCLPCSCNERIIRKIVALGHEIGYHYEDMALTHGHQEEAIRHFEQWLGYFRQFYPVHRICMHGAPTSQYDGRDLWKTYSYRDYGVDYEPYFDEDYNRTFYLTDTGRTWDGFRVSLRDKVAQQDEWAAKGWTVHTTEQLIAELRKARNGESFLCRFDDLLITTHPQRWTDSTRIWVRELVGQKAKNVIKRCLIHARKVRT